MKILQISALGGLLWCVFASWYPADTQGRLRLEISNIQTAGGTIWVGVYDDEKHYFDQQKALIKAVPVSATGRVELEIGALRYGTYAIALFHDVNNNGTLDRNALGVPTEPYAFSQLPRSRWRLPRFDEVQFRFLHNDQVLHTELKRWWD